jgi:hypothetical protein
MNRSNFFEIIRLCILTMIATIGLAAPAGAASNQVTSVTNFKLICTQQQQFTVPSNQPSYVDASVQWMVAGVPGGNAEVGMITANGLYTAPRNAPGSNVEIAVVDASSNRPLTVANVTVVEDPAVTEAHDRWLTGVAAAAAEHGCTGQLVQQLPTETVDDAVKLYLQVADEHACLVLQPVSTEPNAQRYSFASGGEVDGVSILYISDVNRMRIWNGAETAMK